MKKYLKIALLVLLILLSIVFKQYLVYRLPILVNAGAMEDDELMVYHSHTLLQKNWFGDYKYNTLIKNPFFSFFLVLSYKLKISYLNSTNLLYSFSCLMVILALLPKIKNKAILGFIFLALLFNPITFSVEAFQRVYRNSIIPAMSLLVISSYIGMFLYRKKKITMFLWSVLACITVPTFYFTREDSMWLVPLIILFTISTTIAVIIEKNIKYSFRVVFLILPIVCTLLFGNWIANNNKTYYGDKIICTGRKSNFTDALNAIESVKPQTDMLCFNNTKEKLNRIAEVSPSFNTIKKELDPAVEHFQHKEVKEIMDGMFSWAVLLAAYNSGYKTLEQENELYSNITNEIHEAINQGLLEEQPLMPLMGGRALKKEEYAGYLKDIGACFLFISNYKLVDTAFAVESPYYPGLYPYLNYFKEITGNRTILPKDALDRDGNKLQELNDQDDYIKSITPQIKTLDTIKNIYYYFAIIVEILGIISYVFLVIITLKGLFKKEYKNLEYFLVSSALIGSVFTLIVGVAFVDYSKTKAITNLYLVGAYSIFILFSLISIYFASNIIKKSYIEKKSRS